MYTKVPPWVLNPSSSLIPCRRRTPQANPRRIENHVHDLEPKKESMASDENDLPFSIGHISPPPHRMVRYNKHQFGGGAGGGDGKVGWNVNKISLTWKDLRVTVPEKIGGGLWAILQGVTGYVESGEMLDITGPSGFGKSTFLKDLAGRLDRNKRQTGEMLINGHRQMLGSGSSVLEREKRGEDIWGIGKKVTESRILKKKPRFLCLHGFRTSADILRQQLQRWPGSVLGKLDLVFLDAPYLAQGKSDVEGIYDPPYYEWFQFSQDYQVYNNFEESLAYIEDYMIKHGPFDGLMGFSQGAVLSAALPGMQLEGVALTKVPKIKYLILMSAGKLGGSKIGAPLLASNAFSSPLKCPSLHMIGETDYLKEPGIELLESFEDPLVINHPKGHTVARLDEKGRNTMLSFIEKIEKMELLEYM
ncbi:uncharacterized protein LOC131302490 [Rhododendron vialii]|uniref:uncharacterized protein LOC131302490 n=1 Tax=Rhododendron vialii TaxID=182163 RepID=UPI00265DF046|nr:uncharacterized protein LOC131302490 [Rhododendron vialii]